MNRQPTVLVLAATRYQIPVIEKAREMGFRVITLDNRPENPGHRIADQSYFVDTTDMVRVLEISKAEEIKAVVAACTDIAVPTAAFVATELGLPSLPFEGCRVLCDKLAFRTYQKSKNYPHPFWTASDGALGMGSEIGQTWILKPQTSSGSKGVRMASSQEEFKTGIEAARTADPHGRVLMEEFIPGRQGTCEGLFIGGKINRCWITERLTASPPYTATAGHRLPGLLTDKETKLLRLQIEAILSDLGFTETLFDADFVINDDVIILEMAPRLGGNSLAKLLKLSAGVDLPRCCLEMAMGYQVSNPGKETPDFTEVMILGVGKEGKLSYNPSAPRQLREKDWVSHLLLDRELGERVQPFVDGSRRVGEILFSASSRAELLEKEKEILRLLELDVLPFAAPLT